MWELDYKEGWAQKNWYFWTVVLEKTLESPLDCKEIKPVNPKKNKSWMFIGRTDAKAEVPILWPPDSKNWLMGKDPDAEKDWRQEEKVMTEDEMVGWHHQLNGHGFGWTPGVVDGQGGLACCISWGHKESDTTEWLNWTEHLQNQILFCLDMQHKLLRILWGLKPEPSSCYPQWFCRSSTIARDAPSLLHDEEGPRWEDWNGCGLHLPRLTVSLLST